MKKMFLFMMMFLTVTVGFSLNGYAHEKRVVANQYEFIVGFSTEPAFSGQMNGVDLHVRHDGKPVEGIENDLKVTVIREKENKSIELSFRKKYKEPGRYNAYFLPTQPGQYVFLIEGVINGTDINERFVSGEKFSDVHDTTEVRF